MTLDHLHCIRLGIWGISHVEIDALFASPEFFRDRGEEAPGLQAERDALEAEIEGLYQRWEELAGKAINLKTKKIEYGE